MHTNPEVRNEVDRHTALSFFSCVDYHWGRAGIAYRTTRLLWEAPCVRYQLVRFIHLSLTHTHAHTPFLQLHTLSHARNVKTAQIAEGWPGPLGPRQAHTLSLGYRYARPTYAADAMGSVCKDLLTLREDLLTLREDLPTFREDQSVC